MVHLFVENWQLNLNISNMAYLVDKIAIITGGANGIGKATVRRFVAEGAKVAIWDVADSAGEALSAELTAAGANVLYQHVDTTKTEQIEGAVAQVQAAFGRIDILINNAGITRDSTLLKMTEDQWQTVIDVNLTGVFNCIKAVAPVMVEQHSGSITNASSVVGLYGNFGQTNYSATKGGLIAMTKTLSKELGRKGVRVNAVAPGFILTEMLTAMPPEVLEKMAAKVPLNRLGSPDDIANVYVFLSSDMAAYINGATISVDGGISL